MSVKSFIKKGVKSALDSLAPKTQVFPKITSLSPNQFLQGRTALITGGTSGIGYEIAKAFLNAGAEVIITGRNKQRIDESVEKLKKDTSQDVGISDCSLTIL